MILDKQQTRSFAGRGHSLVSVCKLSCVLSIQAGDTYGFC